MKQLLVSISLLMTISVIAALITWKLVGSPDRSVSCLQENLGEHHVCLETVREWAEESVLWVLVNEHEDWDGMVAEFATAVFGDGEVKSKVVVYCDKSGCDSSKVVADRLRNGMAQDFGFEVFVLDGGVKALAQEGK